MLYKFVYVKTPSFGCQIFFRCCGNLWKHHIANFSDVPKSCKNNGLANKPLEAILTNGKWFFCVRIGGSEICWEFFFRKNWQSGKYASKLNSFSISQIGKISWMTGLPEASIIFCTFFYFPTHDWLSIIWRIQEDDQAPAIINLAWLWHHFHLALDWTGIEPTTFWSWAKSSTTNFIFKTLNQIHNLNPLITIKLFPCEMLYLHYVYSDVLLLFTNFTQKQRTENCFLLLQKICNIIFLFQKIEMVNQK